MAVALLLDPFRADRQLRDHLAHLPHQIHPTCNFFVDRFAVIIINLDPNPAGIGRVVARYDFVGLQDVRQFEKLTDLAHFLHDGVVAALFFADAPPFLDGLQPINIVRPHRGQFTRVDLAGHHAGPGDLRVRVRRGVVDLRFRFISRFLAGQSLPLG